MLQDRTYAVIDQIRAVFRQPEIVAGTWKAARAHADDISEADTRLALQQLDPLWCELFPAEQARIVAADSTDPTDDDLCHFEAIVHSRGNDPRQLAWHRVAQLAHCLCP